MKDKFDEDFLEDSNRKIQIKKYETGRKLILDPEKLQVFKLEGLCETEFKKYEKCENNRTSSNIDKGLCGLITNLLVQCITRNGRDINNR